jgi:hypothetical protein
MTRTVSFNSMGVAPFDCTEEYGKSSVEWYRRKSGYQNIFGHYAGFSIYKQAVREGVVLYTNFTPTNVDMHWWLPGCLNRWILSKMFEYPFVELKNIVRLTGYISSTNEKVIKIVEKLGFELEATVKDYYNLSEDMLIYKITHEKAQKWIT